MYFVGKFNVGTGAEHFTIKAKAFDDEKKAIAYHKNICTRANRGNTFIRDNERNLKRPEEMVLCNTVVRDRETKEEKYLIMLLKV